ncbi:MAG: T9SS type A sorting domain-containing protein [Bacteroidota bacterium]
MKYILSILIFLLTFNFESKSQSDTLVIHFTNNKEEKIALSQIQKIQFENVTGVQEDKTMIGVLSAKGNYPNPFQELTNIEFEIAVPGNVEVYIFDYIGNMIQKLECANCQAGVNFLQWNCINQNGNQVNSGVYFYEIHLNNEIQSKKMIVIK